MCGVAQSPEWNFSKFLAVRAEIDAHVLRDAKSPHFPIKPQRIGGVAPPLAGGGWDRPPNTLALGRGHPVYDVRSVVQDDGILCLDNGMYKLWFARHYKVRLHEGTRPRPSWWAEDPHAHRRTSPTRCCWTMRWRRWVQACRPPSRPSCSTRADRWLRSSAMAASS
jgi:hypothetical protein